MNQSEEFYLNSAERGFLATADGSGRPTVVPVCFVYRRGVIYTPIDEKPKSCKALARLNNIRTNPRVAFIVDNYSQDWRRLSYLLIHGVGRTVEDADEQRMARDLLTRKYPQYLSMKLKITSIIAVDIAESRFWAFQPR